MRTSDFWQDNLVAALEGHAVLDEGLLTAIMHGPIAAHADIEVAAALCRLAAEEYEGYGTGGSAASDDESRLILRALRSVLSRLGITSFDPPFRDFPSFRRYWNANNGHGSWQSRRQMIDAEFGPLQILLDDREADAITSTLATAISPHAATGWPRVDQEIAELRRHFESSTTEQDYRNVGNDCVSVLEALSATVYVHDLHRRGDELEPSVANTKDRLDRYVEIALPGPENSHLRKLARASIEFAQAVKHRPAGNRRDAGIAADAVILLANLLRRIA